MKPPPYKPPKAKDVVHDQPNLVMAVRHGRRSAGGQPNKRDGLYLSLFSDDATPSERGDALPAAASATDTTAANTTAAEATATTTDTTTTATTDSTANTLGVIVPDIVIVTGWMYITGDAPCIGTEAVICQASGCRVTVECFRGANAADNFDRVSFLEASTGQSLYLSGRPYAEGADVEHQLSPDQFIDAMIDPNSDAFLSWRTLAPQTIPQAQWDRLMDRISIERNDNDVP